LRLRCYKPKTIGPHALAEGAGRPASAAKREALVNKFLRSVGVTIASLLALPAGAAEIRVGLITSMTGPGASIGIP